MTAERLVEVWRGDFLESSHHGHAVIVDDTGQIVSAWGDPEEIILPRSSCKMIQALPLVMSGAADRAGLTVEQLALSCASHQGADIHTHRVKSWLADLGFDDSHLACGPQWPNDRPAHADLIKADEKPCRYHNNCSGKHCGFLTLAKDQGADLDYVNPNNPVQIAVRDAFETATGETSPGYGIDGCSAPNFATSVVGLGRAVAKFAAATEGASTEQTAMVRLREAMMQHPDLVAGETRACTELMRAAPGVALKTGAEAVFVAIVPVKKIGIALKIEDGSTRGSEAMITGLLAHLGVLDAAHPAAQKRLGGPTKNFAKLDVGSTQLVPDLFSRL